MFSTRFLALCVLWWAFYVVYLFLCIEGMPFTKGAAVALLPISYIVLLIGVNERSYVRGRRGEYRKLIAMCKASIRNGEGTPYVMDALDRSRAWLAYWNRSWRWR
jgi:hypothetical protein